MYYEWGGDEIRGQGEAGEMTGEREGKMLSNGTHKRGHKLYSYFSDTNSTWKKELTSTKGSATKHRTITIKLNCRVCTNLRPRCSIAIAACIFHTG